SVVERRVVFWKDGEDLHGERKEKRCFWQALWQLPLRPAAVCIFWVDGCTIIAGFPVKISELRGLQARWITTGMEQMIIRISCWEPEQTRRTGLAMMARIMPAVIRRK